MKKSIKKNIGKNVCCNIDDKPCFGNIVSIGQDDVVSFLHYVIGNPDPVMQEIHESHIKNVNSYKGDHQHFLAFHLDSSKEWLEEQIEITQEVISELKEEGDTPYNSPERIEMIEESLKTQKKSLEAVSSRIKAKIT